VAVLGKNIWVGLAPHHQPRLSEITIEPISGVLLKFRWLYTLLETWRRAASAESARIEAPRGVRFLERGVPLPSRLEGLGERRELPQQGPGQSQALPRTPTHSRHISGPQKPSSRNNALRSMVL